MRRKKCWAGWAVGHLIHCTRPDADAETQAGDLPGVMQRLWDRGQPGTPVSSFSSCSVAFANRDNQGTGVILLSIAEMKMCPLKWMF